MDDKERLVAVPARQPFGEFLSQIEPVPLPVAGSAATPAQADAFPLASPSVEAERDPKERKWHEYSLLVPRVVAASISMIGAAVLAGGVAPSAAQSPSANPASVASATSSR